MRKNSTGVTLATAAAMLFGTALVGTASAADAPKAAAATIHCTGVNSCKGQSACKSANNSCKGQNSCKGKGFLEMTKADCDKAQAKSK
jgi:uncharacterized membrane protein